ncbi:MAG: hypothetical protein ACOVQ5_10200, partial [Flavobacteriales bacterium]
KEQGNPKGARQGTRELGTRTGIERREQGDKDQKNPKGARQEQGNKGTKEPRGEQQATKELITRIGTRTRTRTGNKEQGNKGIRIEGQGETIITTETADLAEINPTTQKEERRNEGKNSVSYFSFFHISSAHFMRR